VVNPEEAMADGTMDALPSVARGLGLDPRVIGVRSAAELEGALTTAARDGIQALYVSQNPVFMLHRAEIAAMVANMRVAAIYPFREYPQSGGLLSYGADLPDMYRRAASYGWEHPHLVTRLQDVRFFSGHAADEHLAHDLGRDAQARHKISHGAAFRHIELEDFLPIGNMGPQRRVQPDRNDHSGSSTFGKYCW